MARATDVAPNDPGLESYFRWMEGRRAVMARAAAEVHLSPGARVIDVASGDGALARELTDLCGGELVIHDWSPSELQLGRSVAEPVRGDVRHLPFRTGAADLTVAFEIIEHLQPGDVAPFVDELWRITKPRGYLLLSTPNRYGLRSFKGLARYLVDGRVWNANDSTHVTIYSRHALRQVLGRRFTIQRTLGYYLLPEVGSHATPWTYTISSNPLLVNLSYKLVVVARPRAEEEPPARG